MDISNIEMHLIIYRMLLRLLIISSSQKLHIVRMQTHFKNFNVYQASYGILVS